MTEMGISQLKRNSRCGDGDGSRIRAIRKSDGNGRGGGGAGKFRKNNVFGVAFGRVGKFG